MNTTATNKSLITMWVSTCNDHQNTLRKEDYRWNVNLLQVLAAIKTPQA